MKISTSQVATLVQLYQNTSSQKREKPDQGIGKTGQDQLSLSKAARELSQSASRSGDLSAEREQLISELKHRIHSGDYQIPGINVVENMFSQEMLNYLIDQGEEMP